MKKTLITKNTRYRYKNLIHDLLSDLIIKKFKRFPCKKCLTYPKCRYKTEITCSKLFDWIERSVQLKKVKILKNMFLNNQDCCIYYSKQFADVYLFIDFNRLFNSTPYWILIRR
jgi:hypothetical protein